MAEKKPLVIYYSFEGNTQFIAEALAKELSADLLRLRPKKDLRSKGFSKFMWGGRQVVMKSKPELHALDKDPSAYDQLVIGTPVWASTFTPALRTFFSTVELKNKKIALFCTHMGGPGTTLADMEAELAGNDIVGKLDLPHVLSKDKDVKKETAIKWVRGVFSK